jgi:hypothetical protein
VNALGILLNCQMRAFRWYRPPHDHRSTAPAAGCTIPGENSFECRERAFALGTRRFPVLMIGEKATDMILQTKRREAPPGTRKWTPTISLKN